MKTQNPSRAFYARAPFKSARKLTPAQQQKLDRDWRAFNRDCARSLAGTLAQVEVKRVLTAAARAERNRRARMRYFSQRCAPAGY